jgi:hypothetical protein
MSHGREQFQIDLRQRVGNSRIASFSDLRTKSAQSGGVEKKAQRENAIGQTR